MQSQRKVLYKENALFVLYTLYVNWIKINNNKKKHLYVSNYSVSRYIEHIKSYIVTTFSYNWWEIYRLLNLQWPDNLIKSPRYYISFIFFKLM